MKLRRRRINGDSGLECVSTSPGTDGLPDLQGLEVKPELADVVAYLVDCVSAIGG